MAIYSILFHFKSKLKVSPEIYPITKIFLGGPPPPNLNIKVAIYKPIFGNENFTLQIERCQTLSTGLLHLHSH
jgi:hypothetical protein